MIMLLLVTPFVIAASEPQVDPNQQDVEISLPTPSEWVFVRGRHDGDALTWGRLKLYEGGFV